MTYQKPKESAGSVTVVGDLVFKYERVRVVLKKNKFMQNCKSQNQKEGEKAFIYARSAVSVENKSW